MALSTYLSGRPSDRRRAFLFVSGAAYDNELPNVPGLPVAYAQEGAVPPPSAAVDSHLDFRHALVLAGLTDGDDADGAGVAVATQFLRQAFRPDAIGELAYQGLATRATHEDRDLTVEAYRQRDLGRHRLRLGVYAGLYALDSDLRSLVFPADADGHPASAVPVTVVAREASHNTIGSAYVTDRIALDATTSLEVGLRADRLTGLTAASGLSPRLNLSGLGGGGRLRWHAGVGRMLQIPGFLGVTPAATAGFAGTTGAGPAGDGIPRVERDTLLDAGITATLSPSVTVGLDAYRAVTRDYLDTGQFGSVPLFAPFNYDRGKLWGVELSPRWVSGPYSAYLNVNVGRNHQQGVATGQFNFPADELAYIDGHRIVLDHAPLVGVLGGVRYARGGRSVLLDGLYSTGLAGGYADTETEPHLVTANLAVEQTVVDRATTSLSARLSVLNLADRINRIRAADGIGIYAPAYAPRRTLYLSATVRF